MGQGELRSHPPAVEGKTIAPPSSSRKTFRLVAAAVICGAALLQACGLPSNQPSLGAPVVPANASAPSSSNVFVFNNGPQTAPSDLYGFEIYYKFYDDTNGGAGTQYNSDNTQLSATATGPNQLVSLLNYRRAYLLPAGYQEGTQITQAATPLIPITDPTLKTTSFQVTIDFTPGLTSGTDTNFYPQVDLNGSPILVQSGAQSANLTIARYFGIPDSPFTTGPYILEGFGQNDFANDQGAGNGQSPPGDIPSTIISQTTSTGTSPQALVLGLYAIAYGLVDLTTPIYSTPTPLGYIHYYSATFATQSNPTP